MSAATDRVDETLRAILRDVLGLDAARTAAIDDATPLFGAMPELDSMAVASLLAEIEDRTGILIDNDEMGGDLLESFGSLVAFVRTKLAR
jgi:acyl carrier protein